MTRLSDFTLNELGLFITIITGSFSACAVLILKAVANSRCDDIRCFCFKCHRQPIPPDLVTTARTQTS